jgi:hypothetical protein
MRPRRCFIERNWFHRARSLPLKGAKLNSALSCSYLINVM